MKTVRLFAFEDRNTALSVEANLKRHLKTNFCNVNQRKELFFSSPSHAISFIRSYCEENNITYIGRWPIDNEDKISMIRALYGIDYRIVDQLDEYERELFYSGAEHAFSIIGDIARYGGIDKRWERISSVTSGMRSFDLWRNVLKWLSISGLVENDEEICKKLETAATERMLDWLDESNNY